MVGPQSIYRADSVITIHDQKLIEALDRKSIALGQLYATIGLAPHFKLLSIGRLPNGNLNRSYSFSIPNHIESVIEEEFLVNF
jgi:hypothetical protein